MSFLNPFANTANVKPPEGAGPGGNHNPSPSPNPNPSPSPSPPDSAAPGAIPDKAGMNLEFFNTLVKAPENKDPTSPLSVSKDILTPENLKKISEGQNFSSAIPPAILEKLQSGDQAATMEAVEYMTRAAHSAALSQTGAIIDTILAQQGSSLESRIKKDIEKSMNLREITTDVPNIDQPVVRAGFEMISSQFREQFPQASPDQIRTMAQTYFTELSAAINPPSPTPEQQQKASKESEIDWMQYAGFASPSSQ